MSDLYFTFHQCHLGGLFIGTVGQTDLGLSFVFYAFDKRESHLELERKDFNERLMHHYQNTDSNI